MNHSQTISDKRWQNRDDAHTLAAAEEIKSDPNRLGGAKTEAKRMIEESEELARSLSKIASGNKPMGEGTIVGQPGGKFNGAVDVSKLASTGGGK